MSDSGVEERVVAPKTVERLEERSAQLRLKRAQEEEAEEAEEKREEDDMRGEKLVFANEDRTEDREDRDEGRIAFASGGVQELDLFEEFKEDSPMVTGADFVLEDLDEDV